MAFTYRLVLEDGTSADPPTFVTAVPNWKPGDTIPLGPGETSPMYGRARTRSGDPILVVEPA